MFRLVSYLTLGAQAALLKKTEALVEKAEKDARAGQPSLLSMGTNTNQVLIFRVKNCRLHLLVETAVVRVVLVATTLVVVATTLVATIRFRFLE